MEDDHVNGEANDSPVAMEKDNVNNNNNHKETISEDIRVVASGEVAEENSVPSKTTDEEENLDDGEVLNMYNKGESLSMAGNGEQAGNPVVEREQSFNMETSGVRAAVSKDSTSASGAFASTNSMEATPSVQATKPTGIQGEMSQVSQEDPDEVHLETAEAPPTSAIVEPSVTSDQPPLSSSATSPEGQSNMEARIQARLSRSRNRSSERLASPGIVGGRKSGIGAVPDVGESATNGLNSSMTQEQKDQTLKARIRSTAPVRPGASNQPVPGAQPSPIAQQALSASMTQEQKDQALKARLRRTAPVTGHAAHGAHPSQPVMEPPQVVQSAPMTQDQKDQALKARLRRTAPVAAGAAYTQPSPPAPAPPEPTQSAPMTQEQKDQALKARLRRTAPAAVGAGYQPSPSQPTPSVPMTQEQRDQELKARLRNTAPATPTQPSSMTTESVPMTQEQKDQALKARLRSGARGPPPQPQTGTPASMSQADQDMLAKSNARAGRPTRRQQQRHTQAEQDAEAKARARAGYPAEGPPVVEGAQQLSPPVVSGSVSSAAGSDQGLTELERRREQRAAARAERRGNRDEPAPAPESAPPQHQPVFSNMNEDERQRRYDAKMSQMGQSNTNMRGQGRVTPDVVEPAAPQSQTRQTTSTPFSNMSEAERQRRYEAKMNQIDQDHVDRREKLGVDENIDPAQEQPRNGTSIYITSTPKSEEVQASSSEPYASRQPGVVTTADRGVAVAPEVEFGEYTQPMIPDDELAVAIAIDPDEEEDEEKFYAHAVEYDPDSKPPIYKNRRFRLYGIGGACVLIILIVVLVLGLSSEEEVPDPVVITFAPSSAPSSSPTTAEIGIYTSFLAQAVSPEIAFQGTALRRAMDWIMNEDPMMLRPNDPRLVQRYMMAFLYFHSTNNGESEWRSCNPPKEGEDDFCVFEEFGRDPDPYNDTIVYTPKPDRIRWLSGQDVCKWEGVICAGGSEVQGVSLFGQGLTGTLPTELAQLPFLQQISFPFNELTGSIPDVYATLNHLLALEVHGNMLTGTIPDAFYEQDSTALVLLNVGDNLLGGTLDTRLGLMTDLKGLHVFENNFEGSFPTELQDLNYLSFTRFNGNQFEGTIPSVLGSLGQLNELWANQANFEGTIPTELGRLRRLTDLRLWGNRLTGPIPEQLFNLKKLKRFSVRENMLSGTLSTLVGELTELSILRVSTNELTGTIPTEIGGLRLLRLAWLQLNLFEGEMPLDVCRSVAPGKLEFLQTDCFPADDPPNPCRCCSACCDRETKVCLLSEDG